MRAVLSILALLCLSACAAWQDAPYTMDDFATVPKFDAHVHFNTHDAEPMAQARADNFSVLSINVDYPAFPPLPTQAVVAHTLRAKNPGHFYYATTFPMAGFGTPNWNQRTIAHVLDEQRQGAVAVKVWKNVGMSKTLPNGQLVFLDSPLFDPLMQALQAAKLPLINHQGEPKNAWLPLSRITSRKDRHYYCRHPEYHMYLQPRMPSHERLMAARDHFLERHPRLNYIGAHMGSLEWDVDLAAAFLDRFPQATMDLSARMTQLQFQSALNHAKVRNFFITYQDRLIYGSDIIINPGKDPVAMARAMHRLWLADWRYLATDETHFSTDINRPVRGLALPRSVIHKIYRTNAVRVFGVK